MKNQIITEVLILFILFIPILIKLCLYGSIYGKCAKDKTRLPGTGTMNGVIHACQGFLFGICLRLSNLHPTFLALAYISGTVYPIYNLTKRLLFHRINFRDSSFYLNLSDFVVGFTLSIIGIETYNTITGNLNDLEINTNMVYYFFILYITLTIISLMFTFKNPEQCVVNT
jgi:hypothetical protein